MIYIGIVGSTLRTEKFKIRKILYEEREKHGDITVVSGGANGIDDDTQWACGALGIPFLVYPPKWNEYNDRYDEDENLIFKGKKNDIYFERNELIAIKSNYLHAFPLDRKGGTMNTVNHFIRLGKKERLTIYD